MRGLTVRCRERAVRSALAAIALLVVGSASWAIDPEPAFDDLAMQAEYQSLIREVRCLVCQNQSIDDSNADLARDLRVVVRQRISLGGSDQEVLNYLVDRYGDWVLLNPPFNIRTLALWLGPVALLLLGGTVAVVVFRQQRSTHEAKPEPLTAKEQARLNTLLDNDRDAI